MIQLYPTNYYVITSTRCLTYEQYKIWFWGFLSIVFNRVTSKHYVGDVTAYAHIIFCLTEFTRTKDLILITMKQPIRLNNPRLHLQSTWNKGISSS